MYHSHYFDSDDGSNHITNGLYKNDKQIEGTYTGFNGFTNWWNINFVFKNGIGTGTYETEDYKFEGSIIDTDQEKNAYHGKCIFWYNDGEIEEEFYEEGALKSLINWHEEEKWSCEQIGEFLEDEYEKLYLVNGSFSGCNEQFSLIDIAVMNRIGTGIFMHRSGKEQ